MSPLAGQKVAVVGLAASGRAAARLAHQLGADVVGLDRNEQAEPIEGVRLQLGAHDVAELLSADLIIVSPGVPARIAPLAAAAEAGVPLISELGFAARYGTAPVVAITGTNGKSTVTWLTHQLLEAAGQRTFVGGNLGQPVSEAVGSNADVWVVEVSSYQLELPGDLHPRVAAILNLTPDHLARHGTMEGYAAAKADLLRHQTADDWALLPCDSPLIDAAVARYPAPRRARLGGAPGVRRDGSRVVLDLGAGEEVLDLAALRLVGEHNRDNAATACFLARAMGASVESLQSAIAGLEGLPHRMEPVGERDGVLFINDSKATNVDATRTGVVGLDRPAVVLLGGEWKGGGFEALAELLRPQRAVVCFGQHGPEIAAELRTAGLSVELVASMDDALSAGIRAARAGDAVLLSPGCASFDAYDNFAHRGDVFRELVARHVQQEASA